MSKRVTIEDLLGKTVEKIVGAEDGSESVVFDTAEGNSYEMYHSQDCCEHVRLEDTAGDVNDLIGSPILLAEEVSEANPESSESGTWTFYKLSTIKGSVTFRWLGESNGYYSESADFREI